MKKNVIKKNLACCSFLFAVTLSGLLYLNLAYAQKENGNENGTLIRSSVVSWDDADGREDDWGEMRFLYRGETFGTKDALTAIAVIKPGESVHPAHRHAEEEYIAITKGSGTWHLNGKDFPAKEGDVMYIEPWDFHGLVNTGSEPLTFLVVRWTSKGVTPPPEPEGSHGR